MCRSSKTVWIVAIRTTRSPLMLMLCCDVFIFIVKRGVLSKEDLEWLSHQIAKFNKATYLFIRFSVLSYPPLTILLDFNMVFGGVCSGAGLWKTLLWKPYNNPAEQLGQKKREQEFIRSRMWTCIFRVKWCTGGMHNAMARTFLETNSSGDVLLKKLHCYNESFGSKNLI